VVFPKPHGGLEEQDGKVHYRVVDFELLQRTPEYDTVVKSRHRGEYLLLQRDRFAPEGVQFPEHLQPAKLLNVDYVHGHAESTGGLLWVVGRDPRLFDYFLPERWRKTPRMQLSKSNQIYYTQSKDNIHLVWRVSRVGEEPLIKPDQRNADAIRRYGYNSPFEAVSFALELQRVERKSPRDAIYEACIVRFRPIMMTTFAALVGTIPIAVGWGAGGESRQPLGLAVVGGLFFSQMLTLFITPVFYLYMDGLQRRFRFRVRTVKVEQGA